MKDQMERLSRLQDLDDRIRRMQAELDEKPELLAKERRQVEEARARLAEAERKVRDAHKAADRRELEVRSKEAEVAKLEGQLNTATSNKVYSDLLLHIRGTRADIEKLEESILAMMDEAEGLEAALEKVRVEVRRAEDEFREAEGVIAASQAKVGEEVAAKRKIRDHLAGEVDPEVLAVYDRVRNNRNGVGIARVEADAEGSHFCAACQMNVTLQDVSQALRGDRIVQCKSCNRILMVETLPTKAESF